jgi:hypothetical protein
MDWHGYILVELPSGFSTTNRRKAYDATQKNIGLHDTPHPNRNTHGRASVEGAKYIMEGVFTDEEIEKDAIAEMLAPELGLPLPPIKATMKVTHFLHGEKWEASRQACVAYLSANQSEWEEEAV